MIRKINHSWFQNQVLLFVQHIDYVQDDDNDDDIDEIYDYQYNLFDLSDQQTIYLQDRLISRLKESDEIMQKRIDLVQGLCNIFLIFL